MNRILLAPEPDLHYLIAYVAVGSLAIAVVVAFIVAVLWPELRNVFRVDRRRRREELAWSEDRKRQLDAAVRVGPMRRDR